MRDGCLNVYREVLHALGKAAMRLNWSSLHLQTRWSLIVPPEHAPIVLHGNVAKGRPLLVARLPLDQDLRVVCVQYPGRCSIP